jgi:hypothetical protein
MKEFLDPRWGGEMELMIEVLRDQILGVCKRRIQLLHFCPKWFYIHSQ